MAFEFFCLQKSAYLCSCISNNTFLLYQSEYHCGEAVTFPLKGSSWVWHYEGHCYILPTPVWVALISNSPFSI